MTYNISQILRIFIEEHFDLYSKMRSVSHAYLDGKIPNKYHMEGDVWTHTCMVLKEAQNKSTIMKLSALCHDLGKPFVYVDKEDTQRRRFSSHEAVSTFYAKEVLESFDLDLDAQKRIIFIVSNHGSLYNYFKDGTIPEENYQKIVDKFSYLEFKDLTEFYECDHNGRFFEEDVKNISTKSIYDAFVEILKIMKERDAEPKTTVISSKKLKVLIGPPRVGKSTFRESMDDSWTIISRDDLVLELGAGKTYYEKFKSLTYEQNKEIDTRLQKRFREAVKSQENICVDMTNMSKKSRKKWVNNAQGYFTEAHVFIDSPSYLMSRNTPEKFISLEVQNRMMKNFVYPLRDEFNHIVMH